MSNYIDEFNEIYDDTIELYNIYMESRSILSKFENDVVSHLQQGMLFFRKMNCIINSEEDIISVNHLLILYKEIAEKIFNVCTENSYVESLCLVIMNITPVPYVYNANIIKQQIELNQYRFTSLTEVIWNRDDHRLDIIYFINDHSIETFHIMLHNFRSHLYNLHESLVCDVDVKSFLYYQRSLESLNDVLIKQCDKEWSHVSDIIVELIHESKINQGSYIFNNIINFTKSFTNVSNIYHGLVFNKDIMEDNIELCCQCLKKIKMNFKICSDILFKIMHIMLFCDSDFIEYSEYNLVSGVI